jgi:hypothetical protein
MAEKADYLRAFDAAVEYFASGDWVASLPDLRKINTRGTPHSIRQVCALVVAFDDRLPDEVYRVLRDQMHLGSEELQRKLARGGSYAEAARFLLELIEQRIQAIKGPTKPWETRW